MQNDLISIIVPVFNLENELPRCLDSILTQSYQNIEVVVVDDGSSDNSADVMRQYAEKDSRIKPVFQENGGVTSARLHGVREASGQWIGFVDGDDKIESDMYERLLRTAAEYHADIMRISRIAGIRCALRMGEFTISITQAFLRSKTR